MTISRRCKADAPRENGPFFYSKSRQVRTQIAGRRAGVERQKHDRLSIQRDTTTPRASGDGRLSTSRDYFNSCSWHIVVLCCLHQ